MIALAPTHFDRGPVGLKIAIAVGAKTPSPVNLRNLVCAAVKMMSTDTLVLIDTFVQ
jgi:hypothetical protein